MCVYAVLCCVVCCSTKSPATHTARCVSTKWLESQSVVKLELNVSKLDDKVGRCKLDPGLKAPPGFNFLILKRITVLSS